MVHQNMTWWIIDNYSLVLVIVEDTSEDYWEWLRHIHFLNRSPWGGWGGTTNNWPITGYLTRLWPIGPANYYWIASHIPPGHFDVLFCSVLLGHSTPSFPNAWLLMFPGCWCCFGCCCRCCSFCFSCYRCCGCCCRRSGCCRCLCVCCCCLLVVAC